MAETLGKRDLSKGSDAVEKTASFEETALLDPHERDLSSRLKMVPILFAQACSTGRCARMCSSPKKFFRQTK